MDAKKNAYVQELPDEYISSEDEDDSPAVKVLLAKKREGTNGGEAKKRIAPEGGLSLDDDDTEDAKTKIERPSTPLPGDGGEPAPNTPRGIVNTPERQALREKEARYYLIEEEATVLSNRCHAYMMLATEYGKVKRPVTDEATGE